MKAKKRIAGLIAVLLTFALVLFGLCGCGIKSAYDVAVDNGFIGTEQEWLDSLKGADGLNGSNGATLTYDDYLKWKADGHPDATWTDFLAAMGLTETEADIGSIASSVARSAVLISAGYDATDDYTVSQTGSGVLIEGDKSTGTAYIVTNYHVLYSQAGGRISNNIFVYLYGYEPIYGKLIQTINGVDKYERLYAGTPIRAEFVGGSMMKDIAVVKITNSSVFQRSDSRILTASEIRDSDEVTLGSGAIAVGNPLGAGIAATSGVVSRPSEVLSIATADEKKVTNMRVMKIDTAINSGNSGGGLFDHQGRLIGIVNAKIMKDSVDNVAYAIPTNVAIPLAKSIIQGNSSPNSYGDPIATKVMLGVKTQTVGSRSVYRDNKLSTVEEVAISEISTNLGNNAQLSLNDILIEAELNGETTTIDHWYTLSDFLYKASYGDTLNLTLKRNGTRMTVSVPLNDSVSLDRTDIDYLWL